MSSEVTIGHQRSSDVTRGHHRSSEVTRGHHTWWPLHLLSMSLVAAASGKNTAILQTRKQRKKRKCGSNHMEINISRQLFTRSVGFETVLHLCAARKLWYFLQHFVLWAEQCAHLCGSTSFLIHSHHVIKGSKNDTALGVEQRGEP